MPKKIQYSLGIDLGGTKIAVGLCQNGEIIKKTIFPTRPAAGFDGVVNVIVEAAEKVMEGIDRKKILGAGIGSAGQIDAETGDVIYSPNLNWKNAPLGKTVEERLKMPVKVLNDVRAATVAEQKYGNGKGHNSFVNIFVGTGVGSGMVINGQLVNGSTNTAGEIGHICLDSHGPECGCGKKGCLEAYASGTGMENYVKASLLKGIPSLISDYVEGNIDNVTGPIIGKAAENGDRLALKAIKRVGKYLGITIANLHTMINPDVILLGGGMMALKPFFAEELAATVNELILPVAGSGERVLYQEAKFENDAVLLGGAAIFA